LPELPDVVVYLEALSRHIVGHRLERVLLVSPFVLRSVDPPIASLHGETLVQEGKTQCKREHLIQHDAVTEIEVGAAGAVE